MEGQVILSRHAKTLANQLVQVTGKKHDPEWKKIQNLRFLIPEGIEEARVTGRYLYAREMGVHLAGNHYGTAKLEEDVCIELVQEDEEECKIGLRYANGDFSQESPLISVEEIRMHS